MRGKLLPTVFFVATVWDHPRGCGENIDGVVTIHNVVGSPPRMRGKLRFRGIPAGFSRITPADAGKTSAEYLRKTRLQDHPRGCGENVLEDTRAYALAGSPPRMRGKQ